jgi:CubicO group peptidase (beta-lactamase class C family)
MRRILRLRAEPATRVPSGEQHAYSNEGYYLLWLIIARTTGEPYTKWITEHVLRPAGMRTARMYDPWHIVPHVVSSYALKDGRVVHNRGDILSNRGEAIAGWGLYASLDDMIAFDIALRSGHLVSSSDLNELWSNVIRLWKKDQGLPRCPPAKGNQIARNLLDEASPQPAGADLRLPW